MVSLEGTRFSIEWAVATGMKVTSTVAADGQESKGDGTSYEDLNQLLQSKSPAYQQKFNDKLMEKLSKINKDISGEGRKSPELTREQL